MKKLLLVSVLAISALLSAQRSNAQIYASVLHPDSDFGIKAGANFETIVASPFSPAYNTGYEGGIYYAKHWDKASIRIEVVASTASFKSAAPASSGLRYEKGMDTVSKASFNTTYINIPILLQVKISKRVKFEIGPQYNYMIAMSDANGAYSKLYKNDNIFKKGEICGTAGFDVRLTKNLHFDARYVLGFTDINSNTYVRAYDAWTTRAAQLSISYRIY